jgi:hypothetical protein
MKSLLRKKPSQSTRQTLLGSSREKAPDASQKARAANGPAKRRLQQVPSQQPTPMPSPPVLLFSLFRRCPALLLLSLLWLRRECERKSEVR